MSPILFFFFLKWTFALLTVVMSHPHIHVYKKPLNVVVFVLLVKYLLFGFNCEKTMEHTFCGPGVWIYFDII